MYESKTEEFHHGADVFAGHNQIHPHDWLAELVDRTRVGNLLRPVDFQHFAVARKDFVSHVRRGLHEVDVGLLLQPLLDDFHVQQSEEAAAESEPERRRRLRLVEERRVVQPQLLERFPQLAGVRITHSWGCKVAFSFDALPHMGSIDGVHFIAGCNGNGVAMMGYLGHQTARKILDGGKSACVFDRADFPRLPLYNGNPWFLPVVAGWYRLLDHLDQSKASA